MNTIILTGSPKPNPKNSVSQIFAEQFVKNMQNPCEIKRIAGANPQELAEYIHNFDTVIMILPLYIHAMPGIVMKFIEQMLPAKDNKKSIGFIIQAGFIETSQERFVERYFAAHAEKLNYNYLGTVSKGEAAGICMYPNMFKKVLQLVSDLGTAYEATHVFDPNIVEQLRGHYNIPKSTLRLLHIANKLGLTNVGWHRELKKNKAFDRRLDKPFLHQIL